MRSASTKTVLITGSCGGIGQALVKYFKSRGWFVAGTDLDSNQSIEQSDDEAICDIFFSADLTSPQAPAALAHMMQQQTGDTLHALINNAAFQIVKPFEHITRNDYQTLTDVNIAAPFFLIQAMLKPLRAGRGAVINVGSIHTRLSKAEFSLYALSKGALTTMTHSLALALAPEVRVNAVLPAAVNTHMLRAGFVTRPEALTKLCTCHPLQRIAEPDEIAAVVYFLASDAASFMTGAAVPVDGGIGGRLHDP